MKLKVMMSKELPGFVPERAHDDDDAGFDLRAAEDATVYSGLKATVRCGIHVEIEKGFEGQVRSRSGIAKKHSCFVINSPGTIDAGYRGELMVMLHNLGGVPFEIKRGDRIAQLVISALPKVEVEQVESLSDSERGTGGFGSTGLR
jgi:dUTP pyrophosphatase